MKKRLVAAVLTILLLSVAVGSAPMPAYACSCRYPLTAHDAWSSADVVFLGRVLRVTDKTKTYVAKEYLFEVSTVWKGDVSPQYVVQSSPVCSFGFREGETRVVFAIVRGNQPPHPDDCLYRRPKGASSDEALLGPGRPVDGARSPSPVTGRADLVGSYVLPGVALILVIASTAALVFYRQTKARPL